MKKRRRTFLGNAPKRKKQMVNKLSTFVHQSQGSSCSTTVNHGSGVETPPQNNSIEGTISQVIIKPLQLYDPLLHLLKVKLYLNDWWAIAGMGILSAIGLFSWYLIGTLTLLQVLIGSVVVPLWVGTYLFLPSTIAEFFNQIWKNEIIRHQHADRPGSLSYKEFVEKQAHWVHSRWWTGMALLFVMLFWIADFLFVRHSSITYAPLWLRFIMIVVFSATGYIGFLVTVWLLIIIIATTQLFHGFIIRIKPLHPDGSGGLGFFNRFLWISVALVMTGVGEAFGSLHSSSRVLLFVIMTGYLATVLVLLIVWLALPHHVMIQARNKILQPLADEYERAISETMHSTKQDTVSINEGTERLAALQKRYEQVRNSFPTWPIEIMHLRHLTIVLILPCLLALFPLLVDIFTKK